MDVTRLRILTEKSVIGFGKYTDVRVGDLLKLNHTRQLRWIYYNCSKLSFTDEILNKIYIKYDDFKINKPGKNTELGVKLDNILLGNLINQGGYKAIGNLRHSVKVYKNNLIKKNIFIHESKSKMQAKNHGKQYF